MAGNKAFSKKKVCKTVTYAFNKVHKKQKVLVLDKSCYVMNGSQTPAMGQKHEKH